MPENQPNHFYNVMPEITTGQVKTRPIVPVVEAKPVTPQANPQEPGK